MTLKENSKTKHQYIYCTKETEIQSSYNFNLKNKNNLKVARTDMLYKLTIDNI